MEFKNLIVIRIVWIIDWWHVLMFQLVFIFLSIPKRLNPPSSPIQRRWMLRCNVVKTFHSLLRVINSTLIKCYVYDGRLVWVMRCYMRSSPTFAETAHQTSSRKCEMRRAREHWRSNNEFGGLLGGRRCSGVGKEILGWQILTLTSSFQLYNFLNFIRIRYYDWTVCRPDWDAVYYCSASMEYRFSVYCGKSYKL